MKENSLCIHPEFWKILLKCKLSKQILILFKLAWQLYLMIAFKSYSIIFISCDISCIEFFQCISSYGFENNTSLLITSLSSQSTNDLSSSLWFKNVDTDYWSLNNENDQERMATKMPLIKMCGMAILNLRNSRQYTWAFLSLTYSVVKFNG